MDIVNKILELKRDFDIENMFKPDTIYVGDKELTLLKAVADDMSKYLNGQYFDKVCGLIIEYVPVTTLLVVTTKEHSEPIYYKRLKQSKGE